MKVRVITLTEKAMNERMGEILVIHMNDKIEFQVSDGEPEDNTLSRNFNDCYGVPRILRLAHEAGVAGDKLEIINEEVEEF